MMPPKEDPTLQPAPGRGQYDRSLSRERRQAEQRERLLSAVAAAFARGEPSVARAVELARTGRNTFYEYFDDYSHALEAVRARVLTRLNASLISALASARTPIERLRVACRAWCVELDRDLDEATVVLSRRDSSEPLSPAALALGRALVEGPRVARETTLEDELRVLVIAGGAQALYSSRRLTRTFDESKEALGSAAAPAPDKRLVDTLIEVAVRVLR